MTPTHAQSVVIRLPDASALHASVDAADDAGVTLVLAVPPRGGIRPTPAVVEYMTPTGIHRIAGSLRPGSDPAVLRLQRVGEETVQRREWARVEALVPVNVHFEDRLGGFAATVAINLSGGGALIRDPVGLRLGTRVALELHLEGVTLHARGKVVREAAGGSAKGIEIDRISRADQERLVRFVIARQRAHLRLRREGA